MALPLGGGPATEHFVISSDYSEYEGDFCPSEPLLGEQLLMSNTFLDFAAAHGALLAGKRNVVVDEDLLELRRLWRTDHALLRLLRLLLLLSVLFICWAAAVFILHKIKSKT